MSPLQIINYSSVGYSQYYIGGHGYLIIMSYHD